MNCPSRTDDDLAHDGWNQNPPMLAADTTTREDLNGLANARLQLDDKRDPADDDRASAHDADGNIEASKDTIVHGVAVGGDDPAGGPVGGGDDKKKPEVSVSAGADSPGQSGLGALHTSPREPGSPASFFGRTVKVLTKYASFIGPGFMVAVAYIDPGNYATDVAAGSAFKFKLLFIILMSNLFAIFLQSLCVKLGTVTGLNLAENCRAHLPRWLNYTLYVFAESAIIATDIAEVIGSAIALNLLLKIPLVAGCALTIVDVLIILIWYNPSGSMRRLRAFEFFVMALVLGVVVCFCIQLSLIENTGVGEVLKGYLPSSAVVESEGLYLSCGILGATVMPHSLYLGSGIVQARLRDFDTKSGLPTNESDEFPPWRPSLAAIRSCMNYSIVELAISLFTFALFVNSAILITAGASLSGDDLAQEADLFGIYDLLSKSIAPAAGTIFALALLLSGTSAGIVCTIAGQMVSEGALNWTIAPWMRRLITRAISITPAIIIAGAVGKDGLSAALTGSQVALSVILPFVSAPLIYFTCRNRYMTVSTSDGEGQAVQMRNNWFTAILAVLIWLVIVVMNVALLVLLGLGKT
ncbi:MAG: hypothetical protein M1832_001196 [Thelocarpon impressellum]|nr:MAG: hypothetical protein M1832_001196 [Thelocarpon impressellum]